MSDLTTALRGWAERKGITPADFARQMGYSYNHAYQLLRGNISPTMETLGRLAVNYGTAALEDVLSQVGTVQLALPIETETTQAGE